MRKMAVKGKAESKTTKLTAQQDKFCLMYRKYCGDGTKAAIAAGYSEKSAASMACQLLKNPKVQARIKKLADDAKRLTIMDTCERQERLTEIARNVHIDPAAAIRAIDILNKMDGKYLVKIEIDTKVSISNLLRTRMERRRNGKEKQ